MFDTEWSGPAWTAAMEAAASTPESRRRWARQQEWDGENIRTESTRFPVDLDRKLRKYCREAKISRYYLINYMLRTWMAAWEVIRNGQQSDDTRQRGGIG